MDIIIKSFNRPYYLDRCLLSINHHMSGVDAITVLDDGTPLKFLDEIKRRHPRIEVRLSVNHARKAREIEAWPDRPECRDAKKSVVPWELWTEAVWRASEYFVLLEDDEWCVEGIDLRGLERVVRVNHIDIVRLTQTQSPVFNPGKNNSIGAGVAVLHPWYLANRTTARLYWCFLRNKYKLASALRRLGVSTQQWKLNAWALYAVCGAIFRKAYWLHTCRDMKADINEKQQLQNAAEWAVRHPDARFGITTVDKIRTTDRKSVV